MSASRGPAVIDRPRRMAIVLLGAALAALMTAVLAGRATAAPLSNCTPTRGTVVAVDFAHWGGPIVRGCGVGVRSGYALLHAAGFTTTGDDHDGPGVICRLGDAAFRRGAPYPTPSEQSCVNTPPTSAYWAYWVAPAGSDHWTYSPLGVLGDQPRPGEVELWIFGATNVAGTHGTAVPPFAPSALRARPARERRHRAARTRSPVRSTAHRPSRTHPATAPARHHPRPSTTTTPSTGTTTTATTTRAPASAGPPAGHARRRSARRRRRRAPAHRARHPRRRHRTTRHPTTRHAGARITGTVPTAGTAGTPLVAARPTSRRASAGSVTPLIVGAALVALICAGAARAIRLRRREE